MSNGFDRDRNRRQREITKNKNQKGRYHIRISLKDIFGIAEHHEKARLVLRYILTLTKISDNSVLNKDNPTNIGKIKISSIEWYVPHCTPSSPQQAILSKQKLSKTPREFQYVGRSVFMKEVNTQSLWTFELRTQERINVPIWNILGFRQKVGQHSQKFNNDTFCRHPVTSAQ